jgi:predicted negative regulator of RcsB-dependent stress response
LAGYYANIDRDLRRAAVYLNRIAEDSYIAARKHDLLGDVLMDQWQVREAVAAYEKALEINYGLQNTREKLIKIYWKTDRLKAFEEIDRLERIKRVTRLK